MCLETIFRGKEKKEMLAKLKDTIIVWKALKKPDKKRPFYQTDCRHVRVYAGENKFKQPIICHHRSGTYRGGGHFWLTREAARNWCNNMPRKEAVVRCTIKKEWINSMGRQNKYVCVVVKKVVFPARVGRRIE
jgi:hypothetical protein